MEQNVGARHLVGPSTEPASIIRLLTDPFEVDRRPPSNALYRFSPLYEPARSAYDPGRTSWVAVVESPRSHLDLDFSFYVSHP